MRRYSMLSICVLAILAFAETRALNQAPASRQASAARAAMVGVVDPALFKGMQYRLVGPSRGGRVTTVTGVPSQPQHVLHGRRQRRLVPDDRRRRELGADHRRQDPARLDGIDRRRRLGSRTSSTSAPAPTACAATSRPAAASTRRPTAARRGSSSASTTPDRSAPSASIPPNPEHRLGRGDRRRLQAERRARRLQDDRRRQDVEEGAVRQRRRRRDGRRAAAGQSERRLRVDVAPRAQAVDDHQRLAGRRLLQEHRRRRDVHEDHDRPAGRADRQGQPRRDGGEAGSHLRADRSEAGRRVLSIGRRRPDAGR